MRFFIVVKIIYKTNEFFKKSITSMLFVVVNKIDKTGELLFCIIIDKTKQLFIVVKIKDKTE